MCLKFRARHHKKYIAVFATSFDEFLPISNETTNSQTFSLFHLSANTYFTTVSVNGEKIFGMRELDVNVTLPDKSQLCGSNHETVVDVTPISTVSTMSSGQCSIDGGVVSTEKIRKNTLREIH